MKIIRLNEDAKRFYVNEIVSAPGGRTEIERHSFATIEELKQYCKDAGLRKEDIASCGGCDVKDLFEEVQISEEVEKLHTKPNGEYLVKADSGKGYTAFNRNDVAIGGIDDEDADSDDKAIAKFKKNEYSECLNEEYFDTAEYRIQKYEDDIPELMAGMHADYMEGKLDAARYAEVLKQVYDVLADCDYKYTMSHEIKQSDETIEDAEKEVDALIKEPYTESKVTGSCLNGVAEKDGYKLVESADFDEDDPDTWPWKEMVEYKLNDPYGEFLDDLYSDFVEDAYKIVEAEGFTDVFTEPSTQAGRGADFFWAKKNGVDYRGHYDFETLNDGFGECCLEANSREEALAACAKYYANIIINNLRPEEDEDFEYDDEYSDDYTESLEECSGIRAHKVIMGEDIDDIADDFVMSETSSDYQCDDLDA